MDGAGEIGGMKSPPNLQYRHRFPAEIISHAVWLYHVFSLSLRDVELLLAEHGAVVSYETVRRWCQKFGETFAHHPGTTGAHARGSRQPDPRRTQAIRIGGRQGWRAPLHGAGP